MIPYGHQSIGDEDKAAVLAVLESDWLTQGPRVPAFETAMAQACGALHAVAVNSATSALHLACLALDVGPGDRVWTSPNTFVASANCARYCGATVDFVDIDPATLNMGPARLEEKLESAARQGLLPKVVIPVHFAGRPCAMAEIHALSRRYGFRVVEDASHAIGAQYAGNPIGACRHSDITIFSFHPVKIITTGEGGMALTNEPALAERMALLRSHGITREASRMSEPAHGPWYYEQTMLGYNYRMTEMQAALGESQLRRMPLFVAERRTRVAKYRHELATLPLTLPAEDVLQESAWHLFVIRVEAARRRQAFESLRGAGIGVNVHYIPVHLQPDYRALGFASGMFPEAERYYSEAITLPLYPDLSDDDQNRVIAAVKGVVQ